MSKLTRWTIGVVWPLCFLACALAQAGPSEATHSSTLKTYRDVDGETYFALSLRPSVPAPATGPRDILVLVDTSASQTGLFREDALEAVQTIANGLNDNERIHIMAIDLKAVPMTHGFVTAGSEDLQQGLAKLKARTPLGATDLMQGISAAANEFKVARRARSIIYVGDGASRANLPALDELEPLVRQLVDSRISLSSYAVGMRRDVEMLAVLANNTGGSIFVDGLAVSAQEAGLACLKIARGTVVWPLNINWPEEITEAYPHQMPPLRYDRDSIVIGTLVAKDALKLNLNAELDGQQQMLTWSLKRTDTSKIDDYAMLPELVTTARKTGGLTLPLLGSEGLDQARRLFQATSESLSKLGKQALHRGDVEGGVSLLREALRRDPGNLEAKALLKANTSVRSTSTKGVVQPPANIRLAQLDDVLPEDPTVVPLDVLEPSPVPVRNGSEAPLLLDGSQDDGDLMLQAEQEREVQKAIMRTEVNQALAEARDTMRIDPEMAMADLKNVRQTVVDAPDLEASVLAELLDRLEVGLRQTARRRIEKEKLDAVAQSNLAELAARRRLLDADARKQEKVQEYLATANAYLDEERYELAEEVALQMRDFAPRMAAPQVALASAGYLGNYRRMRDLFDLKGRRMNDALYQVELSHVPFPDSPPIQYPSAEEWGPLSERRKARYSKFDLGQTGTAEQRISAALDEPTELFYSDTPLSDVMADVADKHNIPIQFDTKALEDESIDASSDGITIDLSNVSLKSGLRLMLSDLNLTYVIDNEVLMITSKEVAEETLVTKVYPVGDLVMPINSMMMMGGGMMGGMGGGMGGGMMGGMGGGMGGGMMGGGMGGGMMGGMGGGMGGGMMGGGMGGGMMGGGMGGMGMGGGMFDVEDIIRLGKPKPVSQPKPSSAAEGEIEIKGFPLDQAAETEIVPTRIRVTAKPNESSDAAWDRYFAKVWASELDVQQERQQFANVRQTVRELSKEKNFEEVSAVIQSALRNGQYQPWMHHTLGMALRAAGADQETLERAFMSNLDLTQNPDEVVMAAVQLSRLGMDRRAMQLYRDIATAFPLRPEPYIHALEAAKRLKDRDGIVWACQHILEQAWPEKHKAIFDMAVRTAKATIYDLEQAGDQPAADELVNILNDALARDCVVRVTWTGDADIDLLVEEPSGTVCSLRNKRTTSGGVLLGDAIANPEEESAAGVTETYICPRGFSGEYRVLVRRIMGDVAAGKVTVEIATNLKTDRDGTSVKQHIRQQVDLREKDALLTFKLEDGRREEEIEDQIVANAAVRHIAANRSVLAQHFDALEDERVAAANSLSELTFLRTRDPRAAARVNAALRGRGAVGFMPQLTVLPEGTMMMGQSVISADRRYVRVSMSPFFSRIADVSTFNFATGQGQQQQQGGGGQQQQGFGGGGFGAGGGF